MLAANNTTINSQVKYTLENGNKTNHAYLRQKASGIGTFLFFCIITASLYLGWQYRDIAYLTAESGIGYALGITGGLMMLLLLLYPLRKRISALRIMGPIKHWFRLHMILGILGPTLILFHCNFNLGSLNSNVALICMLIVASSGLLGRYFYARIHHGLYGSKATLLEMQQESHWHQAHLLEDLSFFPQLQSELKRYEQSAIQANKGLFSFIKIRLFSLTTYFGAIALWRQCKKAICHEIPDKNLRKQQLAATRANLKIYFRAVRQMADLTYYQRLFSAWHILHLPLFVMMLVTGIIHVIAVHMY